MFNGSLSATRLKVCLSAGGGVMPTAAEFSAAASSLDAIAATANQMKAKMTSTAGNLGVTGQAPVRDRVEYELQNAVNDLASGESAVRSVAQTLRDRATVCADYAADMQRWRQAMARFHVHDDGTGTPPVRPLKPFPWVEEQ